MSETKLVAFRVPVETLERIDEIAKAWGWSRSALMVWALEDRLLGGPSDSPLDARMKSLNSKMDELLRLERLNYENIHALNSNVQQIHHRLTPPKPPKNGFG